VTVARHAPDNLPACSIDTSLSAPGPAAAAGDAIDTLRPASDYSNQAVILGRLKPGRARESHRVVHVFPLATEGTHATTLTARCGEQLLVADVQWLPRLIGMPCDHCLLHSLGIDGGPQITDRVG
jgi:hypothetical protein